MTLADAEPIVGAPEGQVQALSPPSSSLPPARLSVIVECIGERLHGTCRLTRQSHTLVLRSS